MLSAAVFIGGTALTIATRGKQILRIKRESKPPYGEITIREPALLLVNIYTDTGFEFHSEVVVKDGDFL